MTWQVYNFGKINIFRLNLNESREGFCRRGRESSFHVVGLKTKKAQEPTENRKGPGTNSGEAGMRNLEAETIRKWSREYRKVHMNTLIQHKRQTKQTQSTTAGSRIQTWPQPVPPACRRIPSVWPPAVCPEAGPSSEWEETEKNQ